MKTTRSSFEILACQVGVFWAFAVSLLSCAPQPVEVPNFPVDAPPAKLGIRLSKSTSLFPESTVESFYFPYEVKSVRNVLSQSGTARYPHYTLKPGLCAVELRWPVFFGPVLFAKLKFVVRPDHTYRVDIRDGRLVVVVDETLGKVVKTAYFR